MEAIKILVTGANAVVENAPVITCGMVGLPVELHWDESWSGLHKTLIYKAGDIIRDQILDENSGIVPGELLQIPYRTLQIGVYGANPDGCVVIPTVWAQVGQIREGVNPVADPGTDPAIPVWQQLLSRLDALEQTKPQLLWEFAVPPQSTTEHDLDWIDECSFSFTDGDDHDRPWNDRWVEDGQLPANSTMREKANQLCAILQEKQSVTVDVQIRGCISLRGEPACLISQLDDEVCWKMTLVSGKYHCRTTAVSHLDVVEIGNDGMSFGGDVATLAKNLGWSVRVYG